MVCSFDEEEQCAAPSHPNIVSPSHHPSLSFLKFGIALIRKNLPLLHRMSGKKKAYATGGATFTPRLTPRPQSEKYPQPLELLYNIVVPYTRAPLLSVLFVHLIYPTIYLPALEFCKSSPYLWNDAEKQNRDKVFYSASFVVMKFVVWILVNGFFYLIEREGWFDRYKLDRKAAQLPSKKLIIENITHVFIGMFVTGPPLLYFVLYPLSKHFGMPPSDSPLPDNKEMFVIFALCYILNDWGFYWTHRLLHAAPIYKYIHKQHHMYTGTVSFAAEHAHIVEIVLSNYLPTLAGVLVTGAHPCIVFAWIAIRLQQTYEVHSGYCFRGSLLYKIGLTNSDGAAYHDFHHTKNSGNFGGGMYLDYFFGTMDSYVKIGMAEGLTSGVGRKDPDDAGRSYLRDAGRGKLKK